MAAAAAGAGSGPRRVAVIGAGLIGTSIALAAQRAGDTVTGHDVDEEVLRASASRSGMRVAPGVSECVDGAEFVFVCTPVELIGAVVRECATAPPGAVLTDVGSVKRPVLEDVGKALSADRRGRFVGGHPMTGSERTGPEAASGSLLEGAAWVLTPARWTDPDATEALEAYVIRLGGHPMTMDAQRHDELVAQVSHLPQVISSALMSLVAAEDVDDPRALSLAASGFRDVTRLAASDPELWAGILEANREAVVAAIDAFLERLGDLRDRVEGGHHAELLEALAGAQAARVALGAKPRVRAGMAVLQIPVPDRPGVLAQITAALGRARVNIEDLQIVHSPWEPAGVIHLTVLADSAVAALDVLEAGDFEPVRVA
jgi:prephenate dehydrogenase